MFLYDKFCHAASNDRRQEQGAVFLYETIDTLTQLTTAGYFNRAKLDLNLGDLIFATIITEQESTTYETYALRVIGLNDDVIVEQANLSGGGSGGINKVAVDSSLQGDGTEEHPLGLSQETSNHLETIDTDLSELGEQVSTIQTEVNSLKTNVAGKVNIAQGADNAGKVMTVGADGNVVPTAGYATESWVNQQIQTQIGTIETALAEV